MDNEKVIASIAALETRMDKVEERTDHIETLTLSVQKLAMSVETQAKIQVEIIQDQKTLAADLLKVKQAPIKDKANKHDQNMQLLLTFFIGIVSGVIIAAIRAYLHF